MNDQIFRTKNEMTTPLISVLMPAYNAEKYIGETIESVLQQSYHNWEIIVVDDCSTDGTENIVNDYVQRDNRIKYYKLPSNSGNPYVPRNEAARLSKGDFLVHLDSDDYIEKDYFSKFVIRQQKTNADGVLGVMYMVSESGDYLNQTIPQLDFNLNSILTGKEAFRYTVPWQIGLNGAGFRREIVLKAIDQHQNYNKGSWCDEVLSRMFLLNSDKVTFIDAKYFYRVNNSSLVHTFSPKLLDMCSAAKDVKRLCMDFFPTDEIIQTKAEMYVYKYLMHVINQYVQGKVSLSSSDRIDFSKRLHEEYDEISFDKIRNSLSLLSRILTTRGFKLCLTSRIIITTIHRWHHQIKD